MTNADVVNHWVKYCMELGNNTTKNLLLPWHTAANLHCSSKHLYSYLTPIAEYKNGKFYVTSCKYSVTTSRHCSLIKNAVPADKLVVINTEIKD